MILFSSFDQLKGKLSSQDQAHSKNFMSSTAGTLSPKLMRLRLHQPQSCNISEENVKLTLGKCLRAKTFLFLAFRSDLPYYCKPSAICLYKSVGGTKSIIEPRIKTLPYNYMGSVQCRGRNRRFTSWYC